MPAGRVLGVIADRARGRGAVQLRGDRPCRREHEARATRATSCCRSARPLDDVAGAIGFHLPREGLDLAFGQESKTAEGTELEQGSTAILRAQAQGASSRRSRQPTRDDEVNVFVTGDSQAQFVGELLTDMLPSDLFDVSVVARNATGLTNPEFFNWEINAQQEIAARNPDAVVMVIGGNDGFNVLARRPALRPRRRRSGRLEYARRAAVVMRELGSNGKRPVYWVPPPTARDSEFNGIFATQNKAVEQAAAAVPGRALRRHLQHDQPRPLQRRAEDRRPARAGPPGGRGALLARGRRRARAAYLARDGEGLPGSAR